MDIVALRNEGRPRSSARLYHARAPNAGLSRRAESTLRTRGISVPTTDIVSQVVLVVVLGLETVDDEDEEEEDDEGNASTPC
jgi:hypothetical protein